ncbi:MAG: glycyl-radical enzyme activating protein [Synergistaceae bacterium]|nr:glycyl-radical enzyme activating protein [Synergistaceae bacterium]
MAETIRGVVLRIERSSIYDGDGLRTVLFLKGCPLRCLWCSTPESQRGEPERGISREKCAACGKCVGICPGGALSLSGGRISFDRSRCTGCFECARICPAGAVEVYGREMSAEEVVREISKDELFFFHSGGGITISGGEPFAQPRFVRAVLEGCSRRGIDCAVESSFLAGWEDIEMILPFVSLVHTDIKHPNPAKHKALTGVENGIILENILRADRSPHKFGFVIRTPLIPDVNDSDGDIAALAEFVRKLKKLRFMEFLAYHRLGTETYKRLDMSYALREIETPKSEYMERKARLFKELTGLPVKVNGRDIL